MKINNIGIIGNGFVGNAIYENLKNKFNLLVYDIDPVKTHNSLEEVYSSDIIFVCLPTPMKNADGAECNLTIVNDFFDKIPLKNKSLYVIKSTVPIGTTKTLRERRPDLDIVHSPEFLTASNAVEDFKNPDRNIIGGNSEILEKLYKELFPGVKTIVVSSDESESIKYFSNTYLATKVSFFNIMYDVSSKLNLNYSNLLEGVCSDKRIGYSHSRVPGNDGDRGFGGTCFPKDINSLIHFLFKNELNYKLLKEVWEYNKSIRNNWDWANNKSAVSE